MRGASALQKVLQENPRKPLRVLVVWEPVLWTDTAAPTTRTLSRVSDPRAEQYWDKDLLLSKEIARSAFADKAHALHGDGLDEDTIVWDFIALFPPGVRWDASFPSPEYHGYPVVEAVDEVGRRLRR